MIITNYEAHVHVMVVSKPTTDVCHYLLAHKEVQLGL
jgi:hypothetical protein